MEDAEVLRLEALGFEAKRNCNVLLAKQYFERSRTAKSLYELGMGHHDGIQGCEKNHTKSQQYFDDGWEHHGCVLCLTYLERSSDNFKRLVVLNSDHNYTPYPKVRSFRKILAYPRPDVLLNQQ